MERELPKGWILTTLEEVAVWGSGGTPSRSEASYYGGNIPWVKTGDLNDFLLNEIDEFITEAGLKNSSAKIFPSGSVVMAMYGATIGKTAMLNMDAATNQACAVAQVYECISNKFLHYYLKSEKEKFIEKSKGGAQPNISQAVIKAHKIPLPPLAEQQRIVAKLDTAFLHLDTLKKSVQRIPELLKRFRQLVLSQAVTGKLTEAWREGKKVESADNYIKGVIEKRELQYINANKISNKYRQPNYLNYSYQDDVCSLKELPNTWIAARVGLLCDCIVPGRDKPKSFTGKIPWITLPDITSSEITCKHGSYFLSFEEIEEVGAKIIPTESVIMSCIGRFGIAAFVKDPIVINQQLHAFLKSELIIPNYLIYCIQTSESYFNSIATATTISYLNKTNCNSLQVNLPPLEEQQQIVSTVEALFATADAIEGQYRSLKQKINKLPQALLAKAFRGELTEQHAHDEPAAALLQRIRNAKALAKTGSKPYQLFSDDNTGSRVAEE